MGGCSSNLCAEVVSMWWVLIGHNTETPEKVEFASPVTWDDIKAVFPDAVVVGGSKDFMQGKFQW